jgi:hypothetical protein
MIDDDFQFFLGNFEPQVSRREVPVSSIEKYRNHLPEQLLKYWECFGWSGYADGLFWIVNPQEYEPVLSAWLEGSWFEDKDAFYVIARSAFGELYVWGERFGFSIVIFSPESYAIPQHEFQAIPESVNFDLRCFFSAQSRDANDFDGLFAKAYQRLGPLAVDELYGFVPALALGGGIEAKNVQKVSAVEHLIFLAEIEDLKILRLPS